MKWQWRGRDAGCVLGRTNGYLRGVSGNRQLKTGGPVTGSRRQAGIRVEVLWGWCEAVAGLLGKDGGVTLSECVVCFD